MTSYAVVLSNLLKNSKTVTLLSSLLVKDKDKYEYFNYSAEKGNYELKTSIQYRISSKDVLSFSNFGSNSHPSTRPSRDAVLILKKSHPHLIVDGEMQADTAVNPEIVKRIFPFCEIKNGANILVFPNLDAGNIAYKLVQQLGGGEVIGPFLMGVKKAANVLQRTGTVDDVFNSIVMTALEAQALKENKSTTTM